MSSIKHRDEIAVKRDALIKAGQAGRDYPMTSGEWLALASGGITRLGEAIEKVTARLAERTNEVVNRQWIALSVAVTAIAFRILAVGFALWTTRRYIQNPVSTLVDVMNPQRAGGVTKLTANAQSPFRSSDKLEHEQSSFLSHIRRRDSSGSRKDGESERPNMPIKPAGAIRSNRAAA